MPSRGCARTGLARTPAADFCGGGRLAFASGAFDHLSTCGSNAVNSDRFAREARQHMLLPRIARRGGVVALPVGILCHRVPRLRAAVIGTLNLIQTIPSIALFGILMAPLGALAAAFPWPQSMGSAASAPPGGRGAVSVFAAAGCRQHRRGLGRVSPAAVDAARGMGLTTWQILAQIEFHWPAGHPHRIRIVLVQNIGS